MVIPRSRSRSIASSTWSTMSRSLIVPVRSSRRSASVDFPWSMCAMMQKFRMRAWGVATAHMVSSPEVGPGGTGRAGAAAGRRRSGSRGSTGAPDIATISRSAPANGCLRRAMGIQEERT